jgi:hypothetical protein
MRQPLLLIAAILIVIGCKSSEPPLPPLLPETARTFHDEAVPDPVQQAFRKQHQSAKVDKVMKEIVGGDLHYFISYTDPKTGRKGDAEYDEKGEVAMPRGGKYRTESTYQPEQ